MPYKMISITRYGRFFMQVMVSFALIGVGCAMIFSSDSKDLQSIGVGFISTVFGAWVNIKSVKDKVPDSTALTEVVVGKDNSL
jgi:hypothetical protein